MTEVISRNIGWGKSIHETLTKHNLPTQLDTIKAHSKGEWTTKVKKAIEKSNTNRLIQDCHKTEDGVEKPKTKTAHIVNLIKDPSYQRAPLKELIKCTKIETKTILLGRFGMLECGKNFKGTSNANCTSCNAYDDEKHRLNYCSKSRTTNNYDNDTKSDFDLVFSDKIETLRLIIPRISRVWNTRNANGTMITE